MNAPANAIEHSAALVKQVLPLMSRHASDYRPRSYAIWFEYVSGQNRALCDELGESVREGRRLTDSLTFDLYRKHVAGEREQAVSQARDDLEALISKVAEATAGTRSETAEFNGHLERFGRTLEQPADAGGIADDISEMIERTRRLRESLAQREQELAAREHEVRRLEDELSRTREAAATDPLTGLGNRRCFDESLAQMAAHAQGGHAELTLLMIDIDHFKKVNDTYGHPFGDQVIRGVAHAIQACVKGSDLAARYGGEEFAVLLPATGTTGGVAVGNQIRELVGKSRIRKGDDQVIGSITVSVGVATVRAGEPAAGLVERADAALYRSKQEGRNRVTAAD